MTATGTVTLSPLTPELRPDVLAIQVLPDREIHMDHYLPGVCEDLRFTPDEERRLLGASRLHGILLEGVIAELGRLGEAGLLAHLEVVGDFLGFRHYTPARFADTMRWVDLAIVGWPGTPEDAGVVELRRVGDARG